MSRIGETTSAGNTAAMPRLDAAEVNKEAAKWGGYTNSLNSTISNPLRDQLKNDDMTFITETYADGSKFIKGLRPNADGSGSDVVFLELTLPSGRSVAMEATGVIDRTGTSEWLVLNGPREGQVVFAPGVIFGPGLFEQSDGASFVSKDLVSFESSSIDYETRKSDYNAYSLLRDRIDRPEDDTTILSIVETGTGGNSQNFTVSLGDGTIFKAEVDMKDPPINPETGQPVTPREAVERFSESLAKLPAPIRFLVTRSEIKLKQPLIVYESPTAGVFLQSQDELTFGIPSFFRESNDSTFDPMQGLILHEVGHRAGHYIASKAYDPLDGKYPEFYSDWEDLIESDGGVSTRYGKSDPAEDFAETFVLWVAVRSGAVSSEDAEEIEADYGLRFKFLDNHLMKDGELNTVELTAAFDANQNSAGTAAKAPRNGTIAKTRSMSDGAGR